MMIAAVVCLGLIVVGQQAPDHHGPSISEVTRQTEEAWRQGNTKRAIAIAEEAVKNQTEIHGDNHPDVWQAMYLLGRMYLEDGRLDDAEKISRKGLAIVETIRGSEYRGCANFLMVIGQVLRRKSQFADAEKVFLNALNFLDKTGIKEGYEICELYYGLVICNFSHKKFKKCIEFGEKLFNLHSRNKCMSDVVFLQLNSLTIKSYMELGRIGGLESYKKNMISIIEQPAMERTLFAAEAWEELCHFSLADRVDPSSEMRAEVYASRALAIREKVQGPDHISVAPLLERLAEIEGRRSEWFSAEIYLKRIISIREKSQGVSHPDLIAPLWALTQAYRAEKNVEGALTCGDRMLSLSEANPGKGSPTIAEILEYLIGMNEAQGHVARAEELRAKQQSRKFNKYN